jgi:hypothetical protein
MDQNQRHPQSHNSAQVDSPVLHQVLELFERHPPSLPAPNGIVQRPKNTGPKPKLLKTSNISTHYPQYGRSPALGFTSSRQNRGCLLLCGGCVHFGFGPSAAIVCCISLMTWAADTSNVPTLGLLDRSIFHSLMLQESMNWTCNDDWGGILREDDARRQRHLKCYMHTVRFRPPSAQLGNVPLVTTGQACSARAAAKF